MEKEVCDWQWQPSVPAIAVAKFPTGLGSEVETVSQSDSANLQPNYEDWVVTQDPWEREWGRRKKIQSINLCPGKCFADEIPDLQTMNHIFALTWRQTRRWNLSSHMCSRAANGCVSVSPVIKLCLSFHQGDRRRGDKKRIKKREGANTGEGERW